MRHRNVFLLQLACWIVAIGLIRVSLADEPIHMGDEVKFRYGADWFTGKVIGFQNDNRIVEIEVVKDGQQQTFRRSVTQIRPVDAPLNAPPGSLAAMRKELPKSATQMRTWSISDGRISFDGQLTGYDDGWISLLRQDGKTVRVQIARLSAGDQTFLQGIGAAAAEPPNTNSPEGPSSLLPELTSMATGPTIELREMRPVGPIDPDPTPFAFDLPEFETLSLPEASISATTSSALLVDGPRGRLVYSQTTDDGGSPTTAFTLIDIASKATKEIAAFPSSAITLLAADPTSGRAIAVTDFQESNDQAALVWIGGVASGKPSLDTRWPIPENGEGKPMKIRLAFLTPASIAIVQCDDQLFAWDLLRRKTLWRIQGNQALVAITAGGRYLAAQTGRIVGVIDVASGRLLGTVKLKNQFPAGLAFAPDSARLAVSHLNHLQVYDLQDWSIESELDMRVAPQNAYAVSAWLDEQNLMLAGGLIVRPEDHWVIWNYDIKTGRVDRFETLPYGFYSNFYRIGRQSTLLMTSLPHAPVQKLISQRTTSGDRPDLALRPGDGVAVRIDDGNVPLPANALKDAIEGIVQRSGWKVVAAAEVELFAKISRAKEREVEYAELGNSSKLTKVKFAPWQTSLELRRDGKVLWQRTFTTSTPMNVIAGNESFQERVRRMERPEIKSFDRITLRPFMTGTQRDTGYGTSRFDAEGIHDQPVEIARD